MCRALLYLGEPVLIDDLLYKPDNSLVKQAYMPKPTFPRWPSNLLR